MSRAETSSAPPSSGRRLPSPGCLLVLVALTTLALVLGGCSWRLHQRQSAVWYFQRVGGNVLTEPAGPTWLRDLLAPRVGKRYAAGFEEITHLGLGGTKVSDAGLVHLHRLTRLKRLWLDRTLITDAGLVHAGGLMNLEGLSLSGTRITDAGLSHLSGLTNLNGLWLDNTQVTDAGLHHLQGLTGLETLSLTDTPITDAGLQHLAGLTNLRWLVLSGTRVTRAGIEHLERQLPDCAIVAN